MRISVAVLSRGRLSQRWRHDGQDRALLDRLRQQRLAAARSARPRGVRGVGPAERGDLPGLALSVPLHVEFLAPLAWVAIVAKLQTKGFFGAYFTQALLCQCLTSILLVTIRNIQ